MANLLIIHFMTVAVWMLLNPTDLVKPVKCGAGRALVHSTLYIFNNIVDANVSS